MASNRCVAVPDSGEESDENDMLLYLWQRAVFMDSGQGIPREMADSLRLRIGQLSSYHTKLRLAGKDTCGTGQLMKDYLDQYSRVMDERIESKGMNNFNATVETLLAGKMKRERNWKSGLQFSVVKDMPEFKALLEEAELYSKKSPAGNDVPLRISPAPLSSATSSGPSTSQPSHFLHNAPNSKPPHVEPHETKQAYNVTHKPQKRGLFQCTHPTTEASKVTFQQSSVNSHSKSQICAEESSFISSHTPPLKKAKDDEIMEMVRVKSNPFSTARDEYVRQQQLKNGRGGGGSSSNYGSSKKFLGTRRGVSNRFVPPIRRDSEGDSGNWTSQGDVQSRVLKGVTGGESCSGLPPELEGNERLRNIEPRMVELIMNEIMDHSAPVQWSDIAGLEFAKTTIKEIVVWPMMRPDLFTGLRGPPKGILLFGPPGTGKTLIGKCIASQVDATFFSISASSLTSKWIGEGEKMVRALFSVARCFQPAVIFIDEIDSLLSQRSDTEHESSRRIKTEFLVQLDGATTSDSDRLLVIGATNRPQEIDEAARRRLVKRLYIPLPDAPARRQIILNLMKQQPFHLTEDEIELICSGTEGYSGADMANLCREAAYGPVREAASNIQHISVGEMRQVLYRDFEAGLQMIKPSVTENDLDLYIEWNKQFGCGQK